MKSAKSLELKITALSELGYGLGQKAGQIISVARTAPGDQVLIQAPANANRWTSAALVRVLSPGPGRTDSGCAAYDQGCGGCQWRHLDYATQCTWKEKTLADLLRQRAAYTGPIQPLVRLDPPQAYRNKLSLKNQSGRWVLVPETGAPPLAPAHCPVQTPALQQAWAALKTTKVSPALEQLHLRSNAAGQVGLHAFGQDGGAGLTAELQALVTACPGAVGLGLTSRRGYRLAVGEASLSQSIGALRWLIPHNGFFQTNQPQAEVLLDLVRQAARLQPTDRVLDLYCGAGFFGLALAHQAREVVGIEENPQSVAAAAASAQLSGITNARFLAGDLGAVLADLPLGGTEVAIIDPPREGLLPRALTALVRRSPRRIVYISCYPPSLARDYKQLVAAGWRGVACVPLDMFPHTAHVETILTLERSSRGRV